MNITGPRRALCILLGLCAASFFIMELWGKNGPNQSAADEQFTVTQRFYGVDAAEMERIAAVPLEDALSGIRGLKRIFSSSENGRVRVVCYFEGKEKGRYEAVREAAQQVYESLSSAAQRPEISASGSSRVPVWTAALNPASGGDSADTTDTSGTDFGTLLEKILKPALEALPGAGDVEISGTGQMEMVITLKGERAAAAGIDAADIASVLACSDALFPGGTIRRSGTVIPVMVDGRYAGEEALKQALVPVNNVHGGRDFIPLKDIADVAVQERNYESRSRVNGRPAVLAAVMGSDGADLGKLSLLIGEELKKIPGLEYTVLSDRGETERKARSSVLGAALQGACAVALLTALLCPGKKKKYSAALICSLTVPLVIFFSAALLVLFGFSLDKLVLAGLSAGVAAAVDSAILSAEYFRFCKTPEEGKAAMKKLRFLLVCGSATTVIALLPLLARRSSQMGSAAWAVASVNITTMLLTLFLLPPLFFWGYTSPGLNLDFIRFPSPAIHRGAAVLTEHTARLYRRSLAALIRLLVRRPCFAACCWVLFAILGVVSLCINGAGAEEEGAEDYVYAQIEFDGGLHMEETDKALAAYGRELQGHPGVVNVQTVARTGTGSVMLRFDPRLTGGKAAAEMMRNTPVPGGFVYILESSGEERSWRLWISGDEDNRCRELAAAAARICAALPGVTETVLNFKEGSPRLTLKPIRERLASSGLSFAALGQTARRSIHGPVAYKRFSGGGETDVRILGGEVLNRKDILAILAKGAASPLVLDTVAAAENGREAASIQREDRRRGASLSIRTAPADPRRIRDKVMAALAKLELPPGYHIEFDPEAIKAAEQTGSQGRLFIFALLFCYLVIAAGKESFTFPLAVLAAVPPSLALPAFCISLRGYPLNAVSAAAFVAVSGIAVNAAVLVADALQYEKPGALSWYRVYRRRLPVLAATTLTTAAGALPFLFVRGNTALVIKTLSLVSALGVPVSAVCAATLIPALAILFPGILKSFGSPP